MAALVNSSEAQSQASVSSLDTSALAVTAGNFLHVYLRVNSVALAAITITDTAGNTFKPGGYVTTSSTGRLYFFFADNCLGHASNVVHAEFGSSDFCHLTQSHWSGMPPNVGVDFVGLDQGSGGTTISVTPSSFYADQLVIAAADLAGSGHSTITTPGDFTLLSSGTYGPGVGSDDSFYNINTTREFDGSQVVTATFTGGFATLAKSMLVAIYRALPSGVPVPPPLAAQAPCTPQATVSNGGKGKAGCNVGGIGGGHEYAGELGDVPQHDDPDDGETFTGEPGAVLEPWLELVHTDYPSDVKTTYRRAFEELADDSTYEGGRKESGLLAIGEIEHGLGNEQGGFEAATVDIELSDIRDRLIRELADDQDFDGDEARIKVATDGARALGTIAHVLHRGIVQKAALETTLRARLSIVDWLFSDFGPFGPNRKDPNWTFNDLGGAAPEMTSDTKAQAIPLLYGEKSDEGAVDPLTLAPASKGLLPGFYLGMFDLSDGNTPETPSTTGRTLEELIAIMVQLVADEVPPVSWVDTIGFDLGTDDITNMLATTGDEIPTTFEALAGFLGSADVIEALKVGTTAAPTDTTWGFIATGLGPWFQYTGVYGSNLGNGDPQATRDRTKLDPLNRADVLVPGINWPFAVPYFELTNPDTGRTFWLTGIFARGPLLDDHRNGVVNFAFNAIGIEEIGDGSGLPIMRVEDAKQHRLENHWINQWSSGPYVDTGTFPQFEDGVPMVRSSSFLERQNFFKAQLGGEGLLVSWYTDQQQANLDIVRQWNRETESRTGVNQHGQIVDCGFDETVDSSSWPRLQHVTDVFGPITRTSGEERENVVVGSCDYDPDFEKYRAGPFTFQSAAGIQKYKGRIKQGEVIESQILDNQSHLAWVLQRRLARLQFGTTLINVIGPLNPWANYDVGRGVLFNSEDGPGPNGYVDHEFIILRRKADIVAGLMTFTLWDIRDLLLLFASATPSEPVVRDVVYADVGGEEIRSDDTGESVYADEAA